MKAAYSAFTDTVLIQILGHKSLTVLTKSRGKKMIPQKVQVMMQVAQLMGSHDTADLMV